MFNLLIDNCLVLLLNGTRIGRMQRIFADFILNYFSSVILTQLNEMGNGFVETVGGYVETGAFLFLIFNVHLTPSVLRLMFR